MTSLSASFTLNDRFTGVLNKINSGLKKATGNMQEFKDKIFSSIFFTISILIKYLKFDNRFLLVLQFQILIYSKLFHENSIKSFFDMI